MEGISFPNSNYRMQAYLHNEIVNYTQIRLPVDKTQLLILTILYAADNIYTD